MPVEVFFAVLLAAALHAGWNALVKINAEPIIAMGLIMACTSFVALFFLPFIPVPPTTMWPWLMLTLVLHFGYKVFLVKAYVYGDLGQVYPIARGISPLLLGFITVFWIGEELTLQVMSAIGLISLGIFSLMFPGKMSIKYTFRPIIYALATGCFIAAYTLADGVGVRASGNAASYVLWLMALECLPLLGITLILRKRAVFSSIHKIN